MTTPENTSTGPPSVQLMCDGGRDPTTVTKTAVADSVVTRDVDGDEQEMLRVPISSTRSDRENDEFDRDALDDMADQIRAENPMVFDNHGLAGSWMDAIPYDSRETIGAQMDAEVEHAEDNEHDLHALVNPDGTHPEGERMIKQVRDEGQPIKFSVGFKIINSDEKTDDAGNEIGRIFTKADLMETSRVGIPANPDASVTQSVTAKGAGDLPGYANHPMFQMMQAMSNGVQQSDAVSKDAVTSDTVEDGTPVRTDGQGESEKVADLRARIETLEAAIKEEGDPCDDNGDCPDGEECVDGECVPIDDDDEEESGDVPAWVKDELEERRENEQQLREEIAELRDGGLDRGDSKTGDPDMTANAPEPGDTEDSDDETEKSNDTGLLG